MGSERLLVGCDLGGTTHAVLEAGVAVGAMLEAEVSALHVDDYGALLSERFHATELAGLDEMRAAYASSARAELLGLCSKLDARSVEVRVTHGKPAEALAHEAAALDATMLVVGARGKHHPSPTRLGTTAVRVLRLSRRPVLTVDVARRFVPTRRILFATALDGTHQEPVGLVARLAVAAKADVTLLHVSDLRAGTWGPYELPPPVFDRHHALCAAELERMAAKLHEAARPLGVEPLGVDKKLLWAGDVAGTMVETARALDAGLVVVGTSCGKVERVLLGSVAEGVMHRAHTAVLTVPAPPRA